MYIRYAKTGELKHEFSHTADVTTVFVSENNHWIITGTEDGQVIIRGTNGGAIKQVFQHPNPIESGFMSPDCTTLGYYTAGKMILRDLEIGGVVCDTFHHDSSVSTAVISQDGELFYKATFSLQILSHLTWLLAESEKLGQSTFIFKEFIEISQADQTSFLL